MKLLFFTPLLLLPFCTIAEHALTKSDLHHEPVQPLLPIKGLDTRKVILGEKLFREPLLGRNNNMSCASCHNLDYNGANHFAHTPGRDGIELDVNTPTVFNSALNHRQFWDGRANSLEEQVNFVVDSHKEFATSWPQITNKLKQDAEYTDDFNQIYANGINANNVRNAIATFERTLITTNSRFDRYLLGDNNAISKEEKAGYTLFKTYGCVACHQGSNVGGNLFMKLGIFGDYIAERGNPTRADLGRFNITGDERDRNVFRVPSLRLVAFTAPYFHDGSIDTLNKAVKVMVRHQLGREMSEQNINLIVAFLKTLPGEYKDRTLGVPPVGQQEP